MKIILKGEPRSTGSIYKHMCMGKFPRVYMTNEGKALKKSYQFQAIEQKQGKLLSIPLYVDINVYFGTKRRQDIDNFNKLILDALTGIIWVDDSQIMKMTLQKRYDKDNPRVEIEIMDFTQETDETKYNDKGYA